MRANLIFLPGRVRHSALVSIALAIIGFSQPSALRAQVQSFNIAPKDSTARLFIGSRDNPTDANVAIAKVSGTVQLDPSHVEHSAIKFTIFAGNDEPAASADQQALTGIQPVISFESRNVTSFESHNVTELSDGNLRAEGQLTVTERVQGSTSSWGEDYSGPVYGPARLVRNTYPAIFLLTPAKNTLTERGPSLRRLLTATQNQADSALLVTASTSVPGEAFPSLLSSLATVSWPPITDNIECTVPSAGAEDYGGPKCRGKVTDAFPVPLAPAQVGEDYSGIKTVPSHGKVVTIRAGLALIAADRTSAAVNRARPNAMGEAVNHMLWSVEPR